MDEIRIVWLGRKKEDAGANFHRHVHPRDEHLPSGGRCRRGQEQRVIGPGSNTACLARGKAAKAVGLEPFVLIADWRHARSLWLAWMRGEGPAFQGDSDRDRRAGPAGGILIGPVDPAQIHDNRVAVPLDREPIHVSRGATRRLKCGEFVKASAATCPRSRSQVSRAGDTRRFLRAIEARRQDRSGARDERECSRRLFPHSPRPPTRRGSPRHRAVP